MRTSSYHPTVLSHQTVCQACSRTHDPRSDLSGLQLPVTSYQLRPRPHRHWLWRYLEVQWLLYVTWQQFSSFLSTKLWAIYGPCGSTEGRLSGWSQVAASMANQTPQLVGLRLIPNKTGKLMYFPPQPVNCQKMLRQFKTRHRCFELFHWLTDVDRLNHRRIAPYQLE